MNPFQNLHHWFSYAQFLALTEELVAAGKTTGPDQSPEMVTYTRLNLHRMQRWDKTFAVPEALQNLTHSSRPQIWWVITEPWCGDSASILPQLAAIAAASEGHIELRIILRDEHPAIMDRYLTNGSRSIPMLVSMAEDDMQLFVWGPRPAALQQVVNAWKAQPGEKNFEDLKTEVQQWYNRDKGEHLTGEISGQLANLQRVI